MKKKRKKEKGPQSSHKLRVTEKIGKNATKANSKTIFPRNQHLIQHFHAENFHRRIGFIKERISWGD